MIFGEGKTFTKVIETPNINNKLMYNKQNVGAKIYIQKGNSPD